MSWAVYAGAALATGVSLRYHWWRIPVPNRYARVLMYHSISPHRKGERRRNKWRVDPNDFAKQMAWLAKHGWHTVTASELVSAASLPPKTVCITFDDGFEDNYTHAFPLLKRYGFKATVYIVPTHTHNDWEGDETLLTSKQIAHMAQSGLIEFGSHTLDHRNLCRLSSEEARRQIEVSKNEVETLSGMPCRAFAYPYGKYDETIETLVRNAGYTSAVSVKRGVYDPADPFAIRRIGILGTESFADFYLKMTRIRNKF